MKCSLCIHCVNAPDHLKERTNADFQCDNENADGYTLEIYYPSNAGCNSGVKSEEEEV